MNILAFSHPTHPLKFGKLQPFFNPFPDKDNTRSDILQGQALFRRDKQHLTKDVFCLSLSIKIKKYLSKIERGRERVESWE